MAQRRQLGAVFLDSGRITQADVERALEHQRTHGGFFGQALVALGLVSREEFEWALAHHFDLPFIFPNASAVDRDAARLVPPDWALAHLAVPIVRAGQSLTVVVTEPLRTDVIEDLRTRTGCDIEMALASGARIRELIHTLYEPATSQRIDDPVPSTFPELVTHALEQGAERFGISIRGTAAVGWWRSGRETHRLPLAEGWQQAVQDLIDPPPLDELGRAREVHARFDAVLQRGAGSLRMEVQVLVGAGGAELLFTPQQAGTSVVVGDVALPPTLVKELRLLARSGTARVGVCSTNVDTARALLPQLPLLALGDPLRAAHINDSGSGTAPYILRAEPEPAFAEAVAACELDALTIDLPAEGFPVQDLLRAAPIAFMILDEPEERTAPASWGINWLLTVSGQPGSYAWDLRALHG